METNKLIRAEIQALKAYDAVEDFRGLKLDAMESPWSGIDFSPELLAGIKQSAINLYPDPSQKALRTAIANYFSLKPQTLLFGNGSDELITLLTMAIGRAGDTILSFNPSFSVYRIQAIANQRNYVEVDLGQNFALDLVNTLAQIKQHQPVITFIAYPNNPTGNCFEREHIEAIIKQSSGLVVLDEAYYAFAKDDGFLHEIEKYNNLLVMRTFSKLGFAGLRIGLLAGAEKWIQQINKVRLPYNINTLSQYLLEQALKSPQQIEDKAKEICQQRDELSRQLSTLPTSQRLSVYPSEANFILFRVSKSDEELINHQYAVDVFEQLKQQGILIRNLSTPTGLLNGCLRVSIGTSEQNQQFRDTLATIIR